MTEESRRTEEGSAPAGEWQIQSFEDLARLFKTLAEPARLKIVIALSEECRSVSSVVSLTGLTQPTVSRHLAALRSERVVRGQRVGNFVYY